MTRFGALLVGLALAGQWLGPYTDTPALATWSVIPLAAGLVLLLAGREPWPTCCPHCEVYAERRAAAVDERDQPARFEAAAIIAAARHERDTITLAEWERQRDATRTTAPIDPVRGDDAHRG